MRTIEWFPPDGSGPVTFGPNHHRVLRPSGFEPARTQAMTRRAPGQVGASVLDRHVGERTVSLQVLLEAPDAATLNQWTADIVTACAGVPGLGGPPKLGTLRVQRAGRPTVETLAEPHDSPVEVDRPSDRASVLDLEWLCPSPLWFEANERVLVLDQEIADPWTSPWESPWSAQAASAEGEIDNPGDVPADMKVRFWGPASGHRLTNVTTGEFLRVKHSHDAGEYVEVDTAARTVVHHGASGSESLLDLWDWDGTWWRIAKGHTVVRTESDSVGPGSQTVVIWRPAWSGA